MGFICKLSFILKLHSIPQHLRTTCVLPVLTYDIEHGPLQRDDAQHVDESHEVTTKMERIKWRGEDIT